jgi:hypothetical protein
MSDDDRAAKAARAKALVRLLYFEGLKLNFPLLVQQKEATEETWCWRVSDTNTGLAVGQSNFPFPCRLL